jgi:hypothetical protein
LKTTKKPLKETEKKAHCKVFPQTIDLHPANSIYMKRIISSININTK